MTGEAGGVTCLIMSQPYDPRAAGDYPAAEAPQPPMSVPAQRAAVHDRLGQRPGGVTRWLGLLVAAASALLLVTVLLPWATVTANLPDLTPGMADPTATDNGLAAGTAVWGWLTLLSALAAGALGVGGVARNRLTGLAIIPALVALVALIAAIPELQAQKLPESAISGISIHFAALPPVARRIVLSVVNSRSESSLAYGWYLALFMTLAIIGLGIAAIITGRRRAPS